MLSLLVVPASKESGRGAVIWRGPDQARFALVSLTTSAAGVPDWMGHPATAPPVKQEGKRPRDADLLGYPTPTGCSTTRRRLRKHWFLASFALHR
jgi:hypothetical protein